MPPSKILISACLLGQPVRYDGASKQTHHPILEAWIQDKRLIPFCPECAGGLPVPRPPAELQGGDGFDVLDQRAHILTSAQTDVTQAFLLGARRALETAQAHNVKIAILKANSPSCSSLQIYDGSFTGTLKDGTGVTAALLTRHNIAVFDEHHLALAQQLLIEIENPSQT